MHDTDPLVALANLHGLQTDFVDFGGATVTAPEERLRRTLDALGVPVGDADPAPLLEHALREHWAEVMPPVVVAWDGQAEVPLRLPASRTGAYALEVQTENGESRRSEGQLDALPTEAGPTVGGVPYVIRRAPIPTPLLAGYHSMVLSIGGGASAPSLVIAAPRRVWQPNEDDKRWGVFLPLYALHSKRSQGIGDFTDLRNLIEWSGERGGSMVGTLPMLATFLDDPCEPSPYAPVSRLAWNELYLDVTQTPGFADCPEAVTALGDANFGALEKRQAQANAVEHREVMALKRAALEPLAVAAWGQDSPIRRAMIDFLESRPELVEYAKFRAVGASRRGPWPTWPAGLQTAEIPDASYDSAVFRYHAFVQWAAHVQLQALSQQASATGDGLYLDLPVGVHPDGFDIWRHRELFLRGLSTGAPPDALFAGGQNWAFPPLNPRTQRKDHYRYLRSVLQNHLRYAGMLRIDHVMGLHRLFVIPSHAPASEGMYLRYPHEDLYALLSVESHRSRTRLLGENLGVVPQAVEDSMAAHGIAGMHVVQYQAKPDPREALPPAKTGEFASLNTHDMPPFASYWSGKDVEVAQSLGWLDEHEVAHGKAGRARQTRALRDFIARRDAVPADPTPAQMTQALLGHLGRSDASVVLANLEDLWGETRFQNVPGTYREHPNWKHRTPEAFETWREREDVDAALTTLHAARTRSVEVAAVRHDVSRLRDEDLHFIGEGTHDRLGEVLGAHPMTADGVRGVWFGVWAPSAEYVSVIGDFNDWDRGQAPLAARGGSGIWEGFIPNVALGDLYKFHIASPAGTSDRADPLAAAYEEPPRTASIVAQPDYDWTDAAWLAGRGETDALGEPMSIYEVHLGSWRRVPEDDDRMLTYRELAETLVPYVAKMGFSHVELLPVMEHPFYGSWGYQTTGYFAPTARHGPPQDLKLLIDAFHAAGIGVLLDWVPSHFPADAHALARFDGTCLYEHADPRQGHHPDWDSAIFNYGRYEVSNFLVSSARHWLTEFHADGLRVDAVASMLYLDYSRKAGEWIPNAHGGRENLEAIEVLRRLNEVLYAAAPGISTIAEESTAWPMVSRPTYLGGLGFGFKWDMGWMHDTLRYFARDPIHRQHHQHELTFRMIYAFGENFVLPLSHDEVVHGKGSMLQKMPGDHWQKLANLRALYGYMYSQPGKKLLFMGLEFGQDREWNHDRSLDWHLLDDPGHEGLRRWVADLNRLHREVPALHELDCSPDGFTWVDFSDATNSVFAYLRRDRNGGVVLAVCNLTPIPRHDYRIGVPKAGRWRELANSDAACYGGSGLGNGGGRHTDPHPAHEQPQSLNLTLPPLSVVLLQPEAE